MRLAYDENDLAIADATSDLLRGDPPIGQIRAADKSAMLPDAKRWSGYAEQGWFGLSIAEDDGGVGYGLAEQVVLFREIGRALVPGPIVATTVAARAAVRAGATDLAAGLIDGSARAAMVITDGEDLSGLSGQPVFVSDAVGADYLLMIGTTSVALYPMPAPSELTLKVGLDPASRIVTCDPSALGADAVFEDSAAAEARADAEILSAAILSGVADAVVDMSVAYVTVRTQFGKPIGTFQAIQHRCASMAARAETARCQVLFAGLTSDAGGADTRFNAKASLAVAAEAALVNCEDNMRNHAAIAITAEHDAHLFLTRARSAAGALGTRSTRLRALAEAPAPNLAGID